MITPQTIRILSAIMQEAKLTQQDVADSAGTGISRASVGHHLAGARPVRDEHIGGYLAAVPSKERARLFAAWVHDILADHPEILADLFEADHKRIHEGTREWSPELSEEHRNALDWWDMTLRNDQLAAAAFEAITQLSQGR